MQNRALEEIEQTGETSDSAVDGGVDNADNLKNESNVIGGHKATLSNPRVGEEAKEHSRQVCPVVAHVHTEADATVTGPQGARSRGVKPSGSHSYHSGRVQSEAIESELHMNPNATSLDQTECLARRYCTPSTVLKCPSLSNFPAA